MWIAGWFVTCMLCLYQPFTFLVFGKDMLFPISVVILFCIYFYLLKMGDIRGTYNEVNGLWWQNRYRAIFESVLNIGLNYLLGRLFGIYGILLATIISLFFINYIWGSMITFHYYFKEQHILEYFSSGGIYALVAGINCLLNYLVCNALLTEYTYLSILLRVLICSTITNVLFWFIFKDTKIFKDTYLWIKRKI